MNQRIKYQKKPRWWEKLHCEHDFLELRGSETLTESVCKKCGHRKFRQREK